MDDIEKKAGEVAENYLMQKIQPYINLVLEFWTEHKTVILVCAVCFVAVVFFFGILREKVNRDERKRNRRNRY